MNTNRSVLFDKYIKLLTEFCDINEMFQFVCGQGDLEMSKYISESNPDIDISDSDFEAVQAACGNGNINLVKWIFDKWIYINLSSDEYGAFRFACANGHLDVAVWLSHHRQSKNMPSEVYIDAFRWACLNGHINVARWLFSTNTCQINFKEVVDDYIVNSCIIEKNEHILDWFATDIYMQ